jgi:hypothetical protein
LSIVDQFFSAMKESDQTSRKRKAEEDPGDEDAVNVEEDTKTKSPCPICGGMFLEEDINNHLDICLNRSAVLELVRESDQTNVKTVNEKGLQRNPQKRKPFFGKDF